MPKLSLTAQLRDQIEQEIVTGGYKPGERLDEASLRERFGVSRTPVREALMQLSATGLVEIQTNRGAFVRQLSPRRLIEMFEVMAELEALCGRMAARRVTSEGAAGLVEANRACEQAEQDGDPDAYYYANEAFHHMIYAMSASEFLEEEALSLATRLKPYRRLQLRARNRVRNSLAEHRIIVEAIVNGDPDAAADALRTHVLVQGERFSDFFAQLRQAELGAVAS
ncbi:GntR family transcriptional regulator [Arsenicitalea aurantiaca]|uniref:GntR family transcriptional regulator n=1 Tax=Arsenicitalea aurantiaca TaxID=1783274 RepID=A0A433X4B7_9HYPH|nr:GntR family transcriptional regulator [Arsenicitalea aurantiaca]RUT28891.1 GntR family transcriptional regulator [Arsenicitalea aurantiaca]